MLQVVTEGLREGTDLKFVWNMCLKTENYCLKFFVKIYVGKKMCENI